MKKQEKKSNKFLNIIKEHINKNLKQYLIVSIIFFIGIIVGVIVVNYAQNSIKEQIGTTINTSIDYLKLDYEIDYIGLLKNITVNHIIFAFLIWFLGCSVIGIPIVYLLVVYKGFSLGYTISSIIFTLGMGKGILFSIVTLLLQNLFVIPAILSLAVSGMNLYASIMKNKRIENIKIEIIRHTIFSAFMLIVLVVAAIVEVYVSNFIFKLCIGYF